MMCPAYMFVNSKFVLLMLIQEYTGCVFAFNLFMPAGLFYLHSLDRSISSIRGIWCCTEISVFKANSVHFDQTPRSAASDLGLHCLLMSLYVVRRLIWVYTVCQCPLYGTPSLNGLMRTDALSGEETVKCFASLCVGLCAKWKSLFPLKSRIVSFPEVDWLQSPVVDWSQSIPEGEWCTGKQTGSHKSCLPC